MRLRVAQKGIGRCGKRVPGPLSDQFAEYGGVVCLRVPGHKGRCLSQLRKAEAADKREKKP